MKTNYRIERWEGTERPDPESMRKRMTAGGYSVYQWSDPPGTTYSLHQHRDAQSHWIVSGVLELEVQDVGTVTLNPGERDFMPAGTFHSARVAGDEDVVYLIGEMSL